MITKKQKVFILNNLDLIGEEEKNGIIELLIDNMSKQYAIGLIGEIIDYIHEADLGDYENIEDCGDR